MKQTLFEPSARVPLLIGGAGVKARNRSTSRIVEFLDIYPTLADFGRGRRRPPEFRGAR